MCLPRTIMAGNGQQGNAETQRAGASAWPQRTGVSRQRCHWRMERQVTDDARHCQLPRSAGRPWDG